MNVSISQPTFHPRGKENESSRKILLQILTEYLIATCEIFVKWPKSTIS